MNLEEIKADLKTMVPAFARRVAPLYVQLGWKWDKSSEKASRSLHVPPASEIEEALYGLINDFEEKRGMTDEAVGIGGVEAYYQMPDAVPGEPGEYGLRFILEEDRHFE